MAEIETKTENKQSILRYLLLHGPATRQELFSGLGLSLPTIKHALEYMEGARLIAPCGKVGSTGGRNAVAYGILEKGFHAVGLYISQQYISASCLDLSGSVVCTKRQYLPMDLQDEAYLRTIAGFVEGIKKESSLPEDLLLGVGIAVPSLVSEDGERAIFGMTSDFSGITRAYLSRFIPYPVKLCHDADAAGFAEVWKEPGTQNAVYLSLNSSVGGCVLIDGQLYRGNNCLAGEIGHIIVSPESGKRCYCGQIGCFDTLCNTGVLDSYANGSLEDFFRCLNRGDGTARSLWDAYLDHLARAIHNLRMLLDCSFIIGGDLGAYIGDHMQELCERVDRTSIFRQRAAEYIVPCRHKNEATAVGAAIQVLEDFIKTI